MRLAQKLFAPMEFKSLLIWFLYLIAPLSTSISVYVSISRCMKNKLGKVYAFSTKALRSHGIQESAHLVSLLDRSSIYTDMYRKLSCSPCLFGPCDDDVRRTI